MDCWFSKIPTWVWWDIALVTVTGITTWFAEHFRLSRKLKSLAEMKLASDKRFDEFKASRMIDDLERFGKIMKLFEERQDSEGTVYPTKSTDDMEFVYTFMDLQEDCKDWVSIDESTPQAEVVSKKREEAIKSISLIREHGYKKALEIRKKELVKS